MALLLDLQVDFTATTGTGDALKTPNVFVDAKTPVASILQPAGAGETAATSSDSISSG